MAIAILGYKIYILNIIIIFVLIPLFIFLGIKFFLNKREEKVELDVFKITDWERKNIPKFIKDISNSDVVIEYIENNETWSDLILIPDLDLSLINSRLFDYIKASYKESPNRCVSLLRTIDFLNGGFELIGTTKEWLGDDVDEEKYFVEMNKYEARLENIYLNQIEAKLDMVDDDINKIPASTLCYFELKSLSKNDFNYAIDDIIGKSSMKTLKDSTYNIISYSLIDSLIKVIGEQGILPDHRLYLIRALACALDKNLYLDILDTFE